MVQLSITEYRKRHKGVSCEEGAAEASEGGEGGEGAEGAGGVEWSSESSGAGSLSPQRLDAAAAAAADELEQRLHRELAASHLPKGHYPPKLSYRLTDQPSYDLGRPSLGDRLIHFANISDELICEPAAPCGVN